MSKCCISLVSAAALQVQLPGQPFFFNHTSSVRRVPTLVCSEREHLVRPILRSVFLSSLCRVSGCAEAPFYFFSSCFACCGFRNVVSLLSLSLSLSLLHFPFSILASFLPPLSKTPKSKKRTPSYIHFVAFEEANIPARYTSLLVVQTLRPVGLSWKLDWFCLKSKLPINLQFFTAMMF